MKITYDPTVDAAYIHIENSIADGAVAKTECFLQDSDCTVVINADFDDRGILLGLEILGASNCLSEEILAHAHQLI